MGSTRKRVEPSGQMPVRLGSFITSMASARALPVKTVFVQALPAGEVPGGISRKIGFESARRLGAHPTGLTPGARVRNRPGAAMKIFLIYSGAVLALYVAVLIWLLASVPEFDREGAYAMGFGTALFFGAVASAVLISLGGALMVLWQYFIASNPRVDRKSVV